MVPPAFVARVTLYASAEAVAAHVWPGFGVLESLDEQTCVLGADSVQGWAQIIVLTDVDFEVTDPRSSSRPSNC
jgi:hypothetical protein